MNVYEFFAQYNIQDLEMINPSALETLFISYLKDKESIHIQKINDISSDGLVSFLCWENNKLVEKKEYIEVEKIAKEMKSIGIHNWIDKYYYDT